MRILLLFIAVLSLGTQAGLASTLPVRTPKSSILTHKKVFQNIRDTSFDTWDESRLLSLLLEHGVVSPSGLPRAARSARETKYSAYQDAANSFATSELGKRSLGGAYSRNYFHAFCGVVAMLTLPLRSPSTNLRGI
jgi:hypothetical protein